MTLHGHIHNGQIVLDPHGPLPEGALVQVVVATPSKNSSSESATNSFAERYKEVIGTVEDLPSDLSVNLDHYLYGAAKRQ
jgi:hypothetical protein